jgi:GT2 family glycosyltransferase
MQWPNVTIMKIEIISATRKTKAEFLSESALGISLLRQRHDPRITPRISAENTRGLPELYNARIDAANADSILVFIHDDVWIDDIFFGQRVVEGLQEFDVIGVAGNRRRLAAQPAWVHVDLNFTVDEAEHLSGAVAHGKHPFGQIHYFGPAPASCELIDGLFIAAKKSTLQKTGVRFDPRFDFHFYDLDFCRSARRSGLRIGCWPVSLTHQSEGAYGGAAWRRGYQDYLAKWGD